MVSMKVGAIIVALSVGFLPGCVGEAEDTQEGPSESRDLAVWCAPKILELGRVNVRRNNFFISSTVFLAGCEDALELSMSESGLQLAKATAVEQIRQFGLALKSDDGRTEVEKRIAEEIENKISTDIRADILLYNTLISDSEPASSGGTRE
jgi:hypothetical protein